MAPRSGFLRANCAARCLGRGIGIGAARRRVVAPVDRSRRGDIRPNRLRKKWHFGPDIGYNPRCVARCGGRPMRGGDVRGGALFSYVSCEARVPLDHPLRPIRKIVDEALAALSAEFEKLYAKLGRPSIAPEKLLRALLLQAFYAVRSERQLMEQLDYNLLFRWFVGLSLDAVVWDVTVFTKNRERLIAGDIAAQFMAAVLNQERVKTLLWDDHFSLAGTLIEAWARRMAAASPLLLAATGSGTFTARSGATRRMPRLPIAMPGCTAKGRVSQPSWRIWGTF